MGHIVSEDGDDKSDILNRRGSFIGQANNVVFWFGKLDCRVKIKLLKAYCSSFYGSELWDLGNENINALCTTWHQALHRVWKLPYNCHRIIIDLLSNSLSILDLLCKRSLMFIRSCLFFNNSLVRYVSHNAVFYKRMRSSMGRNVQLCYERFNMSLADATGSLFSVTAIDDVCRDKVDNDVIRKVECIIELVMIRDNMLQLTSDV